MQQHCSQVYQQICLGLQNKNWPKVNNFLYLIWSNIKASTQLKTTNHTTWSSAFDLLVIWIIWWFRHCEILAFKFILFTAFYSSFLLPFFSRVDPTFLNYFEKVYKHFTMNDLTRGRSIITDTVHFFVSSRCDKEKKILTEFLKMSI